MRFDFSCGIPTGKLKVKNLIKTIYKPDHVIYKKHFKKPGD